MRPALVAATVLLSLAVLAPGTSAGTPIVFNAHGGTSYYMDSQPPVADDFDALPGEPSPAGAIVRDFPLQPTLATDLTLDAGASVSFQVSFYGMLFLGGLVPNPSVGSITVACELRQGSTVVSSGSADAMLAGEDLTVKINTTPTTTAIAAASGNLVWHLEVSGAADISFIDYSGTAGPTAVTLTIADAAPPASNTTSSSSTSSSNSSSSSSSNSTSSSASSSSTTTSRSTTTSSATTTSTSNTTTSAAPTSESKGSPPPLLPTVALALVLTAWTVRRRLD